MKTLSTPWGSANITQELAEGIFWVETTTHQGGLLIDTEQARQILSEQARKIGRRWEHFLVYEQEHDMMVVFYEHPELYPWIEDELTAKLAADSLRIFHPEYFEQKEPEKTENLEERKPL